MTADAGVLRYTLIVRHPETDAPTALLAGAPVPDWASDLVHEDDLEGGAQSAGSDDAAAKEAAEKAAAEAKAKAEADAKEAAAKAAAERGYPDGDPSESWKVAEIEAYATAKGVDISAAKNNGERVKVLADAASTNN